MRGGDLAAVRFIVQRRKPISVVAVILVMLFYVIPAYLFSYRNFAKLPVVNGIYYFVADAIYRPYFDREYAYDRWEDLHAEGYPMPHGDRNGPDPAPTTLEELKGRILSEIGMSDANLLEARELLENLIDFKSEHLNVDSQDGRFYYCLLKTTSGARRWVEIENAVLRDPALQKSSREGIASVLYVKRLANFMAIGVSTHPIRRGRILEVFHVNEEKFGASDVDLGAGLETESEESPETTVAPR